MLLRLTGLLLLVIIVAASSVRAQEDTEAGAIPESRIALLIGNAAYPAPWKLDTPIADVEAIGARLEDFGFSTTILTDASFSEILLAIDRYRRALKAAQGRPIGFFYFAGHGFMNEREEENFLVPVSGIGTMSAMMTGVHKIFSPPNSGQWHEGYPRCVRPPRPE